MGEYFIGSDGELYHWGIKGMKWGVRRYQNKDGSLTEAGKRRLSKNITSKKTDTTEADKYAREAIESVRGFKDYKHSKVYRDAKRNVENYRDYKDAYWKLTDRIRWGVTDTLNKKYGDYETLERNGDTKAMKKFNDEFKKNIDAEYKKNDVYAMEEALVRKYERVLHDRSTIEAVGRSVVEDVLGVYGDKSLQGAGSAIWGYGRVVGRVQVKDIVNKALTDDITKNASRPFNGWETYRYNNKTREQQLKELDSEFRSRIKKANREGKPGTYSDFLIDQWYLAHDEYERGERYPRSIREHIDSVDESLNWIHRND